MMALALIPCFWFFWTLSGLIMSYYVTIIYGHSESWMMYISETGSLYPECILFAVVFCGFAMFGACTAYITYRFIHLRTAGSDTHQPLLQKVLLGVGWVSCIGTVVVAIFQVSTHPYIHRAGAFVAFGFSAIYSIAQAVKLYRTSFSSRRVCHIRMALSVLMATALIISFSFACKIPLFFGLIAGERAAQICDRTAVITEWLALVAYMMNVLTCFTDFQHICIEKQEEGYAITIRTQVPDFV